MYEVDIRSSEGHRGPPKLISRRRRSHEHFVRFESQYAATEDILTGKWAHFQLGTANDKKPRQTESKSKQVKMRFLRLC